ncbi:AtpZ/AtpI family protein [Patescibacteria group bacterium]|nr:AtpZ/AtpI family protein [Patescibacteria group bacterium]MBU4453234.1 AtpZ/AtpI family protein [Patescibacteria group bacterium]MCG2687778.1 AtpZ/AtpI family protein [Candidatus Parcubacteria bacterium]
MEDSKKPQKNMSDQYYYALAIRIAADFGVSIAVPALVAAYAGVKLDEKFGTKPYILFVLLAIALALTVVIIVKKANYYAKLYQKGE